MQALLPFIHTSVQATASILSNGYTPGGGSRDSAASTRKGIEAGMRPVYGDAEVAPSYGALGKDCFDTKAGMYGKVAIELRYSMLEKSTVTHGDSLIKGRAIAQHDCETAQQLYSIRGDEFVEFQCWTEVQPLDIQAVWITDSISADALAAIVAAAGSTVNVFVYKLNLETFQREWVKAN